MNLKEIKIKRICSSINIEELKTMTRMSEEDIEKLYDALWLIATRLEEIKKIMEDN